MSHLLGIGKQLHLSGNFSSPLFFYLFLDLNPTHSIEFKSAVAVDGQHNACFVPFLHRFCFAPKRIVDTE